MTAVTTERSDAKRRRGALGAIAGVAMAASVVLVGPGNFSTVGAADPVKILPLGNSLTQGVETPGGSQIPIADQSGYRERLEDRLQDVGFEFDFVGNQTSGGNNLDDSDHEGVSGETLSQIRSRTNSLNAAALDPDVVLLMGGSNDLTDDQSPDPGVQLPPNSDAAEAEMAGLIDDVKAKFPDADIIVATLPKFLDQSARNELITDYNMALPGIVAAAGSRVSLVDIFPVITTDDVPSGDAVHPGPFGYGKMADVWFEGLAVLYPELKPTQADPIVNDNFNRANADLGTAPTGQLWSESVDTGVGTPVEFEIVGNEVAMVAGNSGNGIVTVDAGISDADVKLDVEVSTTSGNPSIAVLADDFDNVIVAQMRWSTNGATNRLSLSKVDGGATTELEFAAVFWPDADNSGLSEGPGNGERYEFQVIVNGDDIEVWWDNVRWLTHTLSPSDSSTFGNNTRFGIRAQPPGESGASRWDNFVLRDPNAPLPPPPTTNPPPTDPPGGDDGYDPIEPERAADSRVSPGSKIQAGATFTVDVSDFASEGDVISANLTVAGAAGVGFATLYACGQDQPGTSSLNFFGPSPIANGVITEVGTGGTICVFMSQEGHVIVDVFGDFPSAGFTAIGPSRAGDSRVSPGTKVSAGATFTVDVSDLASAGDALAVNLTVAGAAGIGFATMYACGQDQPGTSSLNFFGPNPIANGVITEVGTSGTICVFMSEEGHVILDVFGELDSALFTAIGPSRAGDSRVTPGTKVQANSTFTVDVSSFADPGDALAVNLTVAGAAGVGFATMYACGQDQPGTSSLNFFGPSPIANGVITEVGTSGTICVFMSEEGHVILDVFGEVSTD